MVRQKEERGNPRLGGELGSDSGHQHRSEKLGKTDAETGPRLGARTTALPVLYAHISSIRKGKLWKAVFCLTQNTKAEETLGWIIKEFSKSEASQGLQYGT